MTTTTTCPVDRRALMKPLPQRGPRIVRAVYSGRGFFLRNDNSRLAYVPAKRRPDNLRPGCVYDLRAVPGEGAETRFSVIGRVG
jgi:hypothetical protein